MFQFQKLTLALLLVSSTGMSFSQETQREPIQLGVNVGLDYSYRNLSTKNDFFPFPDIIKERNDSEELKQLYHVGANVIIPFSNKFAFQTGLQYGQQGYHTQMEFQDEDPEGNTIYVQQNTVYRYNQISLPLRINYKSSDKTVYFIGSLGMLVTGVFNCVTVKTIFYPLGIEEGKFEDNNSLNSVLFSPAITAGVGLKISDRMDVRLEPNFRYSLIASRDTPIKEYLYSAGIEGAFYFKL